MGVIFVYKWDDRYRIGEPSIDSQHRKIFQICDRIMKNFQYYDEERNQRTITEAVKYLKNYTIEHFANEEAYQQSIGYEGFPGHHQKHEEFTKTILEQEKILEKSGYTPEEVGQFVEIVNNWLVEHIMRSDQAIAPKK